MDYWQKTPSILLLMKQIKKKFKSQIYCDTADINLISKLSKNSIVKGVVDQIDERNTLIILENDVKGLLNIAEVSRDKTEDMRSVFKIKEEIESKIIGFDKKNRTIKLSIKAKEEKEEREAIESYKSDEKDSISKTSLGDLLKSKFSRK